MASASNEYSVVNLQELSNDWCLLLLGDKFKLTPENTLSQSGKSVVHLTLNHKKNLGYKSLANAQMNSKNIGYLYAIHHGAKIIFDTEICNDISLSEEVSTAITWRRWQSCRPSCEKTSPDPTQVSHESYRRTL